MELLGAFMEGKEANKQQKGRSQAAHPGPGENPTFPYGRIKNPLGPPLRGVFVFHRACIFSRASGFQAVR